MKLVREKYILFIIKKWYGNRFDCYMSNISMKRGDTKNRLYDEENYSDSIVEGNDGADSDEAEMKLRVKLIYYDYYIICLD